MLNQLIVGDFGKDLDDEHALLVACLLHATGELQLAGVVANLQPAFKRARLAKGMLIKIGRGDIPVGIGSSVCSGAKSHPYEMDVPYLADASTLEDGHGLLLRVLRDADPESVVLVLNSGMTDAARLVTEEPALMKRALAFVTIMGGVEVDGEEVKLDAEGFMTANNANNNTFDMPSAHALYRGLQELGIPMVVVMRDAAYSCPLPFKLYDDMVETGNPIGECMRGRQKPALQKLFHQACAPEGELRGTLPLDRDRAWFVKVFCGNVDPGISEDGDIWPHVSKFMPYDPVAVVAAVPKLQARFFDPEIVSVNGTGHWVIGVSQANNGVKLGSGLGEFIAAAELSALASK